MFKSKKFLLLTTLILCFTFLVGCSSNGDTDDTSSTDPDSTVTDSNTGEDANTEDPTNDKVDADDENAPQDTGTYSETAAVITDITDSTVTYDVYSYISDAADAESDTIDIKGKIFEKTSTSDSFTVENTDTFSVSTYNSETEATDSAAFTDLKVGDTIILLSDRDSSELTGVVIYPAA